MKTLKHWLSATGAVLFLGVLSCSGGQRSDYLAEVTFPEALEPHLVPVTLELPPQFSDSVSVWEVLNRDGSALPAREALGQLWIDRESYGSGGESKKKGVSFPGLRVQ